MSKFHDKTKSFISSKMFTIVIFFLNRDVKLLLQKKSKPENAEKNYFTFSTYGYYILTLCKLRPTYLAKFKILNVKKNCLHFLQ